jgi:hypothetical protein
MRKLFDYVISGSGAEGQTWTTEGRVECEYDQAWDCANRDSFAKLTRGAAIYGKPGVGCNGPYDIHRVLIQQVRQDAGYASLLQALSDRRRGGAEE